MAERDFLNVNDNTPFPFVQESDFSYGEGALPRLGIVDAGFLLGLDSGFVAGSHSVYLYQVIKSSSLLTFYFASDAPGLSASHWEFAIDITAAFGCTLYANALGDPSGASGGIGFLTIGDLSEFAALSNGTYPQPGEPKIEPALLQSLVNTYVKQINVANVGRPCPNHCCVPTVAVDPTVYVNARGLVDDVRFKEGFNCQILISARTNVIEIKALKGGGAGPNCVDLRVTDEGVLEDDGSLCERCQDYVSSVNGVPTAEGLLRLFGEQGISITANPAGNSIDVALDTHQVQACETT